MSEKTDEKAEEEECEKEEEAEYEDWEIWTDPLEELSEIEDAFKDDKNINLGKKTILDVGTDCVKPLYIALKYKPKKIIGINEDFRIYPFESDLKQKSKFFTETEIQFYECSLFDDVKFKKTVGEEKFDFILVSHTLHHLRTGECVASKRGPKRGPKHECREDEKCCVYEFKDKEIFNRLFELGKRVIVYEYFCPHEKDVDRVRGRGGHFTKKEWKRMFTHFLTANHRVQFIKPLSLRLDSNNLKEIHAKLSEVDGICFYVEK